MKNIEDILLHDDAISKLLIKDNLVGAAQYLFGHESAERSDVRERYKALSENLVKTFPINDQIVELHFNPGRVKSTSAITDKETIHSRECFLCFNSLPDQQKGIPYNNYILLVNPFPIFPQHFTIVHKDHKEQNIADSFEDLLLLSRKLTPYLTLFYNGPECGASAPDHLHFQGGTKDFLPLERELSGLAKLNGEVVQTGSHPITAIDDEYRKIILLQGNDPGVITSLFMRFLKIYGKYTVGSTEPLLNILIIYNNDELQVCVFLRDKHRPDVFFSKGEDNFLVSPAAADLSGIMISPLKKDFEKADAALLQKIFEEVGLNKDKFSQLKQELRSGF